MIVDGVSGGVVIDPSNLDTPVPVTTVTVTSTVTVISTVTPVHTTTETVVVTPTTHAVCDFWLVSFI